MAISPMNIEELIAAAKNKTYSKKIALILIPAVVLAVSCLLILIYLDPREIFKVFLAAVTLLSFLAIAFPFPKWGAYFHDEIFAMKIKDMNVGQLKYLYESYDLAPLSYKKTDEKILIEQIMIDIAFNFKDQGSFIEQFEDFEVKGLKHESSSVYSFITMAENLSMDDRVNRYILDTFFSVNFIDDVKLDSIKLRN